MTVKGKKQSCSAIDITRFLFSLLVVAFHCSSFQDEQTFPTILDFILLRYKVRLVVPFFFICSGYFLYTKIDWFLDAFQKEKNYLLRMIRIYLFWSVIYLPCSINSFQYDEAGMIHAVVIYLRNFIFTGSYFHLWYITALVFAVFSIMTLRKRHFNPMQVLAIASLFFLVGLTAQSWFGVIRPLESITPHLWIWLKRIERLIGTTRNGLFFGFFYTTVGMIVAVRKPKVSKAVLSIGFVLSMAVFLAEILLLRKLEWVREEDFYLFQAPAVTFLFLMVKDVHFQIESDFRELRKISALLYYVHPLVRFMFEIIIGIEGFDLVLRPFLSFIFILSFSLLLSVWILILSKRRQWAFLRNLY